jgi:hypothetical protein
MLKLLDRTVSGRTIAGNVPSGLISRFWIAAYSTPLRNVRLVCLIDSYIVLRKLGEAILLQCSLLAG